MKNRDSFVGYGIETPEAVTRRAYRVRSNGLNVYHPAESGAHYSDKPRVAYRHNETGRTAQHRRFNRSLNQLWAAVNRKEESA